jgi:hypothetical protein
MLTWGVGTALGVAPAAVGEAARNPAPTPPPGSAVLGLAPTPAKPAGAGGALVGAVADGGGLNCLAVCGSAMVGLAPTPAGNDSFVSLHEILQHNCKENAKPGIATQ